MILVATEVIGVGGEVEIKSNGVKGKEKNNNFELFGIHCGLTPVARDLGFLLCSLIL